MFGEIFVVCFVGVSIVNKFIMNIVSVVVSM